MPKFSETNLIALEYSSVGKVAQMVVNSRPFFPEDLGNLLDSFSFSFTEKSNDLLFHR